MVTLMQLGQLKNVFKVTQVFLQCIHLKIHKTQPVSSENFRHLLITSCSHEKDTRLCASDGKVGGSWEEGYLKVPLALKTLPIYVQRRTVITNWQMMHTLIILTHFDNTLTLHEFHIE